MGGKCAPWRLLLVDQRRLHGDVLLDKEGKYPPKLRELWKLRPEQRF